MHECCAGMTIGEMPWRVFRNVEADVRSRWQSASRCLHDSFRSSNTDDDSSGVMEGASLLAFFPSRRAPIMTWTCLSAILLKMFFDSPSNYLKLCWRSRPSKDPPFNKKRDSGLTSWHPERYIQCGNYAAHRTVHFYRSSSVSNLHYFHLPNVVGRYHTTSILFTRDAVKPQLLKSAGHS